MTNKIEIKQAVLSSLQEDTDNANQMPASVLKQLADNIKKLGFWQPILVHLPEKGGKFQIVDGHHRAKAARMAGLESVPVIVWDGTDEMRRGFAVSMNKLRGELNLSAVQRVLSEMSDAGLDTEDLMVTGYTEQEIDAMVNMARQVATDDDAMENGSATPERAKPAPPDPSEMKTLTFSLNGEDFAFVRKALRKAAGKGGSLADGLLVLARAGSGS